MAGFGELLESSFRGLRSLGKNAATWLRGLGKGGARFTSRAAATDTESARAAAEEAYTNALKEANTPGEVALAKHNYDKQLIEIEKNAPSHGLFTGVVDALRQRGPLGALGQFMANTGPIGLALIVLFGAYEGVTKIPGLIDSNAHARQESVKMLNANGAYPGFFGWFRYQRDLIEAGFGHNPSPYGTTAQNQPGLTNLNLQNLDPNSSKDVSAYLAQVAKEQGIQITGQETPAQLQSKIQQIQRVATARIEALGEQAALPLKQGIQNEINIRQQLYGLTNNINTLVNGHRPTKEELGILYPGLFDTVNWKQLLPPNSTALAANEFPNPNASYADQIAAIQALTSVVNAYHNAAVMAAQQNIEAQTKQAIQDSEVQGMENRYLQPLGAPTKSSDGKIQCRAVSKDLVASLLHGVALPYTTSQIADWELGRYDFRNTASQAAPSGNITAYTFRDRNGKPIKDANGQPVLATIRDDSDPTNLNKPLVLVRLPNGTPAVMALDDYNKLAAPVAGPRAAADTHSPVQPAAYTPNQNGSGSGDPRLIRASYTVPANGGFAAQPNGGYNVNSTTVTLNASGVGQGGAAAPKAPPTAPRTAPAEAHGANPFLELGAAIGGGIFGSKAGKFLDQTVFRSAAAREGAERTVMNLARTAGRRNAVIGLFMAAAVGITALATGGDAHAATRDAGAQVRDIAVGVAADIGARFAAAAAVGGICALAGCETGPFDIIPAGVGLIAGFVAPDAAKGAVNWVKSQFAHDAHAPNRAGLRTVGMPAPNPGRPGGAGPVHSNPLVFT